MNIEESIFKKSSVIFKNLIPYCFIQNDNNYIYSKNILNNTFKVVVEINFEGKINGKVIELAFNEEYTNYRVNGITGQFANNIRNEFENILIDIKNHCFKQKYFITEQANRITDLIIKKYNNIPEFAWEKFPSYGIFRNPQNAKWYGLIMNINRNKLDKNAKNEEIEIINVKLDENEIQKLLLRNGFYKAYHMNKTNWVTIILDNTLRDEEIMQYIDKSHEFAKD